MSLLLTLPLEIRFFIIDLVLNATQDGPELSLETYQNKMGVIEISSGSWGKNLWYRRYTDCCVSNGDGLLLACQQLRRETLGRLSRSSLKLDIVFLRENFLVATWTCIPTKQQRHADLLEAQIRIHGPYSGDSLFQGGDGGPPQILWSYYNMLVRFLKAGSSGVLSHSSYEVDECHTIGTLDINVLNPKSICDDWEFYPALKSPLMIPLMHLRLREDKYVLRAEMLCGYLQHFMGNLLSMGRHFAEYGAILYERVGKINFRVDGHLVKEYDLAARLAKPSSSACFSVEWQTRTHAFRKRKGLPVVEPDQVRGS